ncbi:inositol 2-dehydrogenase [Mesorhizobium sp. M0013]|uniref:inositol 2-dehydrogenase n=1 Tax=Mesorhizobium sp. M0013 TaxID=2956841 RepID=UPI0033388E2C
MIGIGLIGAGRIGALHAQNIAVHEQAELVAVYDSVAAAAETLASRHGGRAVARLGDIFDDPAVEAIFICSPTDTHVDLIGRAAAAGKAIFCEKPIDIDLASALRVQTVLANHRVPFMTGFHRRFDPSTRRLAEHVGSGALGQFEFMRVMSRDPAPPPINYLKRSGGIFRDMTIHDLDLCRWLTGREFTGVFAKGTCLVDPEIGQAGDFDTAFITLWTADGASCVLQNSRRSNGGFDQRIEIMGSRAAASMDNVPLTQTRLVVPDGLRSDALPNHFPERYRDAYVAQFNEFVAALQEGRDPTTTAIDGLSALQLADACARSAESGRPVALTPIAAMCEGGPCRTLSAG